MSEYTYDFSSLLNEIDLNNIGIKDIKGILEQLSVDELVGNNKSAPFAANRTTYLYSGSYYINGVYVGAGTVANAIDDGRTLDKTIAAKFLTDDTSGYNDIFAVAFKNDMKNGTLDLSLIESGIRNPDDINTLKSILASSDATDEELKEAIRIAKKGYDYNATDGAWRLYQENLLQIQSRNVHTTYKRVFAWSENCFTSCGL